MYTNFYEFSVLYRMKDGFLYHHHLKAVDFHELWTAYEFSWGNHCIDNIELNLKPS